VPTTQKDDKGYPTPPVTSANVGKRWSLKAPIELGDLNIKAVLNALHKIDCLLDAGFLHHHLSHPVPHIAFRFSVQRFHRVLHSCLSHPSSLQHHSQIAGPRCPPPPPPPPHPHPQCAILNPQPTFTRSKNSHPTLLIGPDL
jgi:hypothetical protein